MEKETTIQVMPKPKQTITNAVKESGSRLFGFIRTKVDNKEDAEDILQDVWFQLSNLVNADEIAQMGSWLFRVARNKITDKYRKKKNEYLDDQLYEDEEGEFSFKEILLADHN